MPQVNTSNNKLSTRDLQIDAYRALIMIFIPCFIHTMYWMDKAGDPIRSMLLFEMPVIFYISGASIYIANTRKSIWETCKNRFKRIMVPYYRYAAVCLILVILLMVYKQSFHYISIKSLLKLISAQDQSLPIPYMYHLWFILPYLIVSCLFPLEKIICDKVNRWKYLIIYFLLLFFTEPLWDFHHSWFLNIIRQALYFNFFFTAGYLTYKRVRFREILIISFISGAVLSMLLIRTHFSGGDLTMQSHKFPPDILFTSFGILSICLLSLILRKITIPYNRVLHHWNKHGYTLYLWQNFSFFMVAIVYSISYFNFLSRYPLIDFFVAALLIFIFEYAISIVVIKSTRISVNYIRKIAGTKY